MLETGDRLRTWSLPAEPHPGATLAATSLPDHRLAYLDYEGPLSGNRGIVRRWDTGSFEIIRDTGSELAIRLTGQRLLGTVRIAQTHLKGPDWRFRLLG
jgi:hypothetical protein